MFGTFVSVGNTRQPFRRLLDVVRANARALPQPVVVQSGHTEFFDVSCCAVPFLEMEQFVETVANASLVILHAGAGGVIHALKAGKLPVVVPRRAELGEHVDDHQVEFGRALGRSGRVVLVEEMGSFVAACREALVRQVISGHGGEEPQLVRLVSDAIAFRKGV